MARKPKVIEIPGDVAPVEQASDAAKAAAHLMSAPEAIKSDDGDFIEIGGSKRLILSRSVTGWLQVEGVGHIKIEG